MENKASINDAELRRRSSLQQQSKLLSIRLNTPNKRFSLSRGALRKPNFSERTGLAHEPTVSENVEKEKLTLRRSSVIRPKLRNEKGSSQLRTTKSHSLFNQMTLKDFEIGKVLGKGKFGRVYCVKHKATGLICALKAMEKKEIIQYTIQKQFRREVEIQGSFRHKNLTRLYGFFCDDKRVYLLMEYVFHGELYRFLKNNGPLNEPLASYFVFQMANALDYMHRRNIVHRDIKPENILIGFNNTIKLTDFGWSVFNENGQKRKTLCGTIDYLSPELIKSRKYDKQVDVWALGVLTYELLVGSPPFEEDTKEMTYKRILRCDLRFPSYLSNSARSLIAGLLQFEPEQRLPLSSVKTHPWILSNKDSWSKL